MSSSASSSYRGSAVPIYKRTSPILVSNNGLHQTNIIFGVGDMTLPAF